MSYCNKCNELLRKVSKLTDALMRCNHFAVAAKNRLVNGDPEQAAKGLDAIAEYSKDAIETISAAKGG